MSKVIVIHANCCSSTANGDFTFAGSLAVDLYNQIKISKNKDIDIVLVTPQDSVFRFKKIYGDAKDGKILINKTPINISALETFDTVNNTVIAFIDANYSKNDRNTHIFRRIN